MVSGPGCRCQGSCEPAEAPLLFVTVYPGGYIVTAASTKPRPHLGGTHVIWGGASPDVAIVWLMLAAVSPRTPTSHGLQWTPSSSHASWFGRFPLEAGPT